MNEKYEQLMSMLKDNAFMAEFTKSFVSSEHPTNQQSVIRSIHNLLVKFADAPYRDLRNDESVRFAKSILKNQKDTHFPFI